MEYSEYFSKIYEDNKDTTNDAVEDKKRFKNDFYNLVLDALKIKEYYDKHFFAKRELSSEDLSFLNEFTNFILSDSNKNNSSQESTTLARGTGRKQARKNGRDIINHKYELYANELASIYSKFEQALKNDENINFHIEYNPIVSSILKIIAKNSISSISEKLIETIDSLSAPAFSIIFHNFSSDITKYLDIFWSIVNELKAYDRCNLIFMNKDEELSSVLSKIMNKAANSIINQKPLSNESNKIRHEIRQLENKAGYRKTKRDLKNKQAEFDKTIVKDNLELLSELGITPSDFHYKENFETDFESKAYAIQDYYNALTKDLPDLIIHFNKTKK